MSSLTDYQTRSRGGSVFFAVLVILLTAALLIALAWLLLSPAAAQMSTPATELAARQDDLGGWLPVLEAIAAACVPVVSAAVYALVSRFVGIKNEQNVREAINTATSNAAGLGMAIAADQMIGKRLNVGSPVAETVLSYIKRQIPEALASKHAGDTSDQSLLQRIQAKAPQIAAGAVVAAATSSAPIMVAGDQPGPGQLSRR